MGAEIHHLGADNRPGDILLRFVDAQSGAQFGIVVEVRDRQSPKGRKAISDDLTAAMTERGAKATKSATRSRLSSWCRKVKAASTCSRS